MYTISKEFHFSASHQLFGLPADHPCSRLHGHNYVIIVEIASEHLDLVGFVQDYHSFDPIKKFIDENWDHKHLNDTFPMNPTAENMANYLYHIVKDEFPLLKSISVKETPKTIARYERD